MEMVHTKTLLPAFNPVTVADAKLALLSEPAKFTMVHVPVPEVALFAAKV